MDKAQFLEMIKALTPRELRVLTYVHKCSDSTSLFTCCNERRCVACHIQHMSHDHTPAEAYAFGRFASAGTLTWPGYEPTKVNKKGAKRTRTVSSKPVTQSKGFDIKDLSDEQLDRLAKLLIERGSK